ncbi:asparagine synthase (glutamine-hydrolyzing) [Synechococcus sp. HK01-R]|uniref:asparagine synthase (glutamine-hydrolyzing) n=1 Tax=Synechococcus sp. HK01-R TaxID=2751171 RepID=UPI001624AB16|nr:asparagine synthase (glutamine-hydrolyzing) [Synechococcus sp. HK01-R]QNG27899.1 asparagine synthase (glutamine-hydrolyzing) [Synechococcus sp. HK01-R]
MCGIAGFSLFESVEYPSSGWYNHYFARLSHRGPDGHGYYQDFASNIGLVHTRLSILDPSENGRQPMRSLDNDVVVTFNGEIYNFSALKKGLESQGFLFKGSSDTEVLLASYLACRNSFDGSFDTQAFSDFLNRLNGIFAFAIWDKRFDSLILARDAFGVKPLYFQESRDGFFFASEIKCLDTAYSDVDVVALERYLTFLWNPGPSTPVRQVAKLEPGNAMVISRGLIQEYFSWYRLSFFNPLLNSTSIPDKAEAIHGSRSFLRQAVHRQMVSDVPVGAFLSGGLDSSSVVAFAQEINSDLQCFTINVRSDSSEGFSDDLPYAQKVARHLGVPLNVVDVDAARMAHGLEDMVYQLDEPLADPASLNVLLISQLARDHGIKVLLSGAGGDDIFTGYRRHFALQSERYWRWLPRPLRIQLRNLSARLPVTYSSFRRLRKAFSGAHLNGDQRLVHYFRWIDRADLHDLFTPAFRHALGSTIAEDPMLAYLAELPSETDPLHRMLALEQRFFLSDHNLNYTDKMSMAAGVEVRVPFLDRDLVEFSSRISPHFKQRGGQSKWVLKKAMEPILPYDVIYRPKSGFGAPLRSWLRYELKDWLFDNLSTDRLRRRGLFDPQAVHGLISSNSEGDVDASYTLLSLACIEVWCRRFIDQPALNLSSHS